MATTVEQRSSLPVVPGAIPASSCTKLAIRAGATGPVGPVLAGPIFVRKRGVTGCVHVLTLQ